MHGKCQVNIKSLSIGSIASISDALHILAVADNFLSLGAIADIGVLLECPFIDEMIHCFIDCLHRNQGSDLYRISTSDLPSKHSSTTHSISIIPTIDIHHLDWHSHLDHINLRKLHNLTLQQQL